MSKFYVARHAAPRTSPSVTQRAGVGVLAATALGLGATTMTATSASANGGPEASASTQAESSTGGQSNSGSTSFSDVVQQGDSGSVVEEIQEKVGVAADGTFGSQTEQAVASWQSENGLSSDGVVGPKTGSKMGISGGDSDSTGGSQSAPTPGSTPNTASAPTSGSTANTASSSSSSASTSGIVGTAEGLIGSPYVYGGTSPSGFDCSGFVQYVYGQNGKDVPRTTQQQMAAATPVSDPQPGDIVFFGDDAYHNGIYVGDGKMIDAGNSDSPVQERDIWTDDVSYGRF